LDSPTEGCTTQVEGRRRAATQQRLPTTVTECVGCLSTRPCQTDTQPIPRLLHGRSSDCPSIVALLCTCTQCEPPTPASRPMWYGPERIGGSAGRSSCSGLAQRSLVLSSASRRTVLMAKQYLSTLPLRWLTLAHVPSAAATCRRYLKSMSPCRLPAAVTPKQTDRETVDPRPKRTVIGCTRPITQLNPSAQRGGTARRKLPKNTNSTHGCVAALRCATHRRARAMQQARTGACYACKESLGDAKTKAPGHERDLQYSFALLCFVDGAGRTVLIGTEFARWEYEVRVA
jgi:hypothetical protein